MLLSSPSFSGFLDTLSQNPAAAQSAQQVAQPRVEQQQPQRQVRKDVNPYAATAQQMQQQHIGMTLIPEHNMDFSMLDLTSDGSYAYQPQVFSVLSMPETVIDTEILSGKAESPFTPLASEDVKVELPKVERAPEVAVIEEPVDSIEVVDEEFDADPTFALFSSPSVIANPVIEATEFVFDLASIDSIAKPSQYELVVAPVDDASSDAAMKRLQRLTAQIDLVVDRLSNLTMNF
jgi:hypothetical protein